MLSDEFVAELKRLCQDENVTLWQQGDLLVRANLPDEEMAKVAQIVQRKASTLRDRERVSREFPVEMRDTRHAWGIYRVLMRVPDSQVRRSILDARAEWTLEAMEIQVREWVRNQTGQIPTPQAAKMRSGMRLGNVRIIGTLVDDRIKLTIEAPATDLRTFEDGKEVVISAVIP